MTIELRPTTVGDLEELFTFQLDEQAGYLAAFMPDNFDDKAAYLAKYTRFLNEPTINNQTIIAGGRIIGSIAKFEVDGNAEVTYWIDRNCWGKGVATQALKKLLIIEPRRPIYARTAFDNLGSQQVLLNAGFTQVGTDRGFASARQMEIQEFIYRLD